MAVNAGSEPVMRRESDIRHAYLLALGDALRPLADPLEIQATASRILGEQLGASRVAYVDVLGEDYVIERPYTQGVPGMAGRYAVADFGPRILATYRSGRIATSTDVAGDDALSEAEHAAFAGIQVGAYIGVPLIKRGEFVACLAVHQAGPRQWTPEEIVLVEETAERTWAAVERARAEEALSRSEEKYRTLFTCIDEAFVICELLYDDNGRPHDRRLLEANPRYREMIGPEMKIGGTAREVFPEIEDFWFERYHEVVTTGNAVRHENHSQGMDRWFSVYVSRVGGPGSRLFAVVFNDITERRRRETNLAFLAEVSSDLVSLTSVRETMGVLGAKIGGFLGIGSCAFAEIDEPADRALVEYEWRSDGMPGIAGTYRVSEFLTSGSRDAHRSGQHVAVADVLGDPRVNAESFIALGMRAFICVPIIAEGRWQFAIVVHDRQPRQWRDDQIDLVREISARIWTRLQHARAELALQASDERQRALFSQMIGGVAETDLDGRFTNVNRRYCEMVGYTAGELLGMRMQDICHEDDRAQSRALMYQLRTGGNPFDIEQRCVRRDGSVVWTHDSVAAVSDKAGVRQGIIVVSVDITGRKQEEEKVRLGAELLNFLIDRSPTGFYIVDADFRISHMNADSQARAFRNVNPAIGRSFDEAMRVLWSEPLASEIIGIFRHTLATGEPYFSPGLISERADTAAIETYDWQLQRITMPDGRYAVVCYYYDTTQLREAEQGLREADRRKDEFLATLAHELRNPLAPLRNGLRVLRRIRTDNPDVLTIHQMMERQVDHMVRLVDDLMEVSRITRGKVELRRQRVDLREIAHTAVETSRPLIDAGTHELVVSLCDAPVVLDADAVRLTQAVANLLNNSAKYTDRGGRIALTVSREADSGVVSIRDNGSGIPPDMLAKVFDLFTQVDRTYSRAQGGLGIGLTLVRSMVDMHGGTVEARSEGAGRGSEFIVRLPLAAGGGVAE